MRLLTQSYLMSPFSHRPTFHVPDVDVFIREAGPPNPHSLWLSVIQNPLSVTYEQEILCISFQALRLHCRSFSSHCVCICVCESVSVCDFYSLLILLVPLQSGVFKLSHLSCLGLCLALTLAWLILITWWPIRIELILCPTHDMWAAVI